MAYLFSFLQHLFLIITIYKKKVAIHKGQINNIMSYKVMKDESMEKINCYAKGSDDNERVFVTIAKLPL